MPRWPKQSEAERFYSKVEKGETCWIWKGAKHPQGYGVFRSQGRLILAHRFSYMLAKGPLLPRKEIDHLCQNPSCVNPGHLELVTRHENIIRGVGPAVTAARQRSKTHCPKGHRYDLINTQFRKDGRRRCRECRRLEDVKRRPFRRAWRTAYNRRPEVRAKGAARARRYRERQKLRGQCPYVPPGERR